MSTAPSVKLRTLSFVANAFPCQNTRIRAIKRSSLTLPKARLNVPKKQRQYYSGKKKRHTVKIQVIYGRETEKIISIQTGMGAQHDMRLAKKHLAELYPYKIVIADRGYQGLAKTGLQIPKKKSKHHPLNKQDKEANRRLGKLRTVIEHINRKLKIFKILSLPYRNRRKRFGLRANLIAGLVNAMG